MIIKITYPNLPHSSDLLCFLHALLMKFENLFSIMVDRVTRLLQKSLGPSQNPRKSFQKNLPSYSVKKLIKFVSLNIHSTNFGTSADSMTAHKETDWQNTILNENLVKISDCKLSNTMNQNVIHSSRLGDLVFSLLLIILARVSRSMVSANHS